MAIYSKLVLGQGDLVGHIAYSVYRDELIKYIEKYKTEHKGEDIPDEKLSQYKEIIETDSIIKQYRDRGNEILQICVQEYFDEYFNKYFKGFTIKVNKEISDQIKKDIQASFDVTFRDFLEKTNKEISEQIKKDITPNLPPKEPRWKKVLWGSVQSMCGACLLCLFIWFFTNIAGRYTIGDVSIEIKHNGKQAQQEQVVQPK